MQQEKQNTSSKLPAQSSLGTSNNHESNCTNADVRVKYCKYPPGEYPAFQLDPPEATQTTTSSRRSAVGFPPKPKSLYPSSILCLAMVVRGDIGYLTASLAQKQGIFANQSSG
ncbi:hypothetical protein PAAG_03155 [Paracoccidioides lutzii Pb01]|uniref:Uncharacterized protein n=1 Tax=Paracoccidioides lutzii (strain ATCC MYA-826 / Pb01) TaxID=502779 RepID=C1GYK1_PARBA|nr:hypothetical protein PAAG_03155 [Paracoccidioides lutzii Pb01]EEH41592.2 hypothetical protein PAAG_03155 [Paracoccidioides lutzii Pb01]